MRIRISYLTMMVQEIADIVSIAINQEQRIIEFYLYHCKYSHGDIPEQGYQIYMRYVDNQKNLLCGMIIL